MSRRFGRNQKRRMREGLAAEQARVASAEKLLATTRRVADEDRRRANRGEEFAEEVLQLLGPHALAVGEPVDSKIQLRAGETQFSMVPQQFPGLTPCDGMTAACTITHQVMEVLQVEAVRIGMASQMHCMVTLAGKQSAYALSSEALALGDFEYLERHVSRKIAQHLLLQIRGGRR